MDRTNEQFEFSTSSKLRAVLELMRPANIITAFADILAGFAAAGGILAIQQEIPGITLANLGWLIISTFGLYGGGVVFNDVFDAGLDAEERPERAIPSGRISMNGARLIGSLLLLLGVIAAFQVTIYSGFIATAVAACALIYDAWAKHSVFWGPLFMGLCRGGNLLLGCSILPAVLFQVWYLSLIPVVYIASITLISQGEVHGGSRLSGFTALMLINLVTLSLMLLPLLNPSYLFLTSIPFIALFALLVIPPFVRAAIKPVPILIKKAVKRGVLSLIVLNSALAAGFGGLILGMVTLLLLPLSLLFAKAFAVT